MHFLDLKANKICSSRRVYSRPIECVSKGLKSKGSGIKTTIILFAMLQLTCPGAFPLFETASFERLRTTKQEQSARQQRVQQLRSPEWFSKHGRNGWIQLIAGSWHRENRRKAFAFAVSASWTGQLPVKKRARWQLNITHESMQSNFVFSGSHLSACGSCSAWFRLHKSRNDRRQLFSQPFWEPNVTQSGWRTWKYE